ncbi:MAG: hypothetical protein N3F09_03315 [Bacteroidia bacterium]|nr:hypothetical protein [Bacteroidia bacterium]
MVRFILVLCIFWALCIRAGEGIWPYRDFQYFNQTKKKKQPEVRPFITDDARVVGDKLFQIESWVRFDKESGQHWILGAYGPNANLELTFGGVHGYAVINEEDENHHVHKRKFSYAFPLLQVKVLFKEYFPGDYPGVGAVFGTFLPVGLGAFRPPGYGSFGYLTISQCIGEGEKVLIHGNVGGNYLHDNGMEQFINTWGFGSQIKVYKGMHAVMELFSGDPYIPGTGTAYQLGFRYFFNNDLQIDGTIGQGIGGRIKMPFWASAGVRIVFQTKKKEK